MKIGRVQVPFTAQVTPSNVKTNVSAQKGTSGIASNSQSTQSSAAAPKLKPIENTGIKKGNTTIFSAIGKTLYYVGFPIIWILTRLAGLLSISRFAGLVTLSTQQKTEKELQYLEKGLISTPNLQKKFDKLPGNERNRLLEIAGKTAYKKLGYINSVGQWASHPKGGLEYYRTLGKAAIDKDIKNATIPYRAVLQERLSELAKLKA